MVSKSYPSLKKSATSATENQTGFFDFRHVALASPPRATSDHASRALPHWALRDSEEACTNNVLVAPLAMKSATLKKRYFFWILLVLALMHLSQLMAKNDAQSGGWTPPIEPPGSVIVTPLSEGSPIQRPGNRAAEVQQRTVNAAPATTTAHQLPPTAQASGNETALRQAIEQWSQAWGGQVIPQYLSMYASDFEPSKGLSRPAWVQQRTQRITSKKTIRHDIQNLTIQFNASQATVRFTQLYQDERVRASDRKTMNWVWRSGQWQITREATD
jgi:hypothetical protein